MKTNLIRTAATTVALVLAISVNGQNTKSFKENSFANKFTNVVKENVNTLSNELKADLDNLKSAAFFKPETSFAGNEMNSENIVFDLKELEASAKFNPASALTESSDNSMDMSAIMEELKAVAKFQPKDLEINNNSELSEVMNQLAAVVRYTPES